MNYKEKFETELDEIKKSQHEFSQNEKTQKEEYAQYIRESLQNDIEEIQKRHEKPNKIKSFFNRLMKVL